MAFERANDQQRRKGAEELHFSAPLRLCATFAVNLFARRPARTAPAPAASAIGAIEVAALDDAVVAAEDIGEFVGDVVVVAANGVGVAVALIEIGGGVFLFLLPARAGA